MNTLLLSAAIVVGVVALLWNPTRKLIVRCVMFAGVCLLLAMGAGLAGSLMPPMNERETFLLHADQDALLKVMDEQAEKEDAVTYGKISTESMVALEGILVAPEEPVDPRSFPQPPRRKPTPPPVKP